MNSTGRARLFLPSKREVVVGFDPEAPPVDEGSLAALEAFERGTFSLEDPSGDPVDAGALAAGDFQLLRAYLTSIGRVREREVERPCGNCGLRLRLRPCAALELAPFRDGDLRHPDLDAPFPYGTPLPIEPIPLREGEAAEIELRPAAAGDLRPLFAGPQPRLTGRLVAAMGLVRLGSERDPARIARALQRSSDEAWSSVAGWLDQAWYPPRLEAWTRCERCGARVIFEAPASKEFAGEEAEEGASDFVDFERFSALVERHAERIFARAGMRGVGLFVDDDVAACDDGGVPLLGSYEPGVPEDHGVIARPPEVRLYYRTFKAMHDEDGPYDLEAEIVETLEHELDHHRAYLEGEDPQDELERAEIAAEWGDHVGQTETLRRASRSARQGVGDFIYRTWPVWLLAAAGLCWELWAGR